MKTIFHITGGLGKHVLFSAILNSYKKTYPEKEIIVSCAYPEIYEKNPNISESLNLNKNQYFYKNYIHNKDIEIFAQEPYKQSSHILKQKHLINTWCDLIQIEYICPPSLHISFRESEYINKKISKYGDKPILIFQPFGGMKNSENPYCWARDIHPKLAQDIINLLCEKYTIFHICHNTHPFLENCVRIDDPLHPNILFSMLRYSSKRILIDSCLQHAAYAMNLPSTVIWNITSPEQFGYAIHENIISNKNESLGISNSYLFNHEISGIITDCPYSSYEEMINSNQIMDSVKNII